MPTDNCGNCPHTRVQHHPFCVMPQCNCPAFMGAPKQEVAPVDGDKLAELFAGPSGEVLDMTGKHNKDWPNPHFEIEKPMANGVTYKGCVCLQPVVTKPDFNDEEKDRLQAAAIEMLRLTAGKGMNFTEVLLMADGRTFKMRIEIREIRE